MPTTGHSPTLNPFPLLALNHSGCGFGTAELRKGRRTFGHHCRAAILAATSSLQVLSQLGQVVQVVRLADTALYRRGQFLAAKVDHPVVGAPQSPEPAPHDGEAEDLLHQGLQHGDGRGDDEAAALDHGPDRQPRVCVCSGGKQTMVMNQSGDTTEGP